MSIYTIKFATQDDISKMIKVYSEWTKFTGVLPDNLIKIDTFNDLIKYFDGSNKTRKYVIAKTENEDVIGVCYIDLTFLDLNNVRLGNMIVKEKYRRIGVGSALVDKIIDFAKRNNIYKIWFWTQEELNSAIKFYKSKGFELEGKQKKQFCDKSALLFGLVLKR